MQIELLQAEDDFHVEFVQDADEDAVDGWWDVFSSFLAFTTLVLICHEILPGFEVLMLLRCIVLPDIFPSQSFSL